MRISCPNCGAQYEVPDEVIPAEGRDVQCSNCGDTWFQAHPDHAAEAAPPPPPPRPARVSRPEPEPEPDPEPDPEPETVIAAAPPPPAPLAAEAPPPTPRRIDPQVAGILRDEAEHEARQRAREGAALESQGDLGLDSLPADEAGKRSREARDRMARMRGEPAAPAAAVPQERPRSRLLPDVEEINSTLNAGNDQRAAQHSAVAFPVAPPRKSGGFARGFGLVVLVAIGLVLVYIKAAAISAAVPALAPTLEGYTGAVDAARLWLDSKLSAYIPR